MHPRLKQRIEAGETAYGGWVVSPDMTPIEAFLGAGYDFVGIDCQHSWVSEAQACDLLRPLAGAEAAAVIRVSDNDPALIGQLLDAGADAVIVPMVNTVEEARRAASAFRYPPAGSRSFGPLRRDLGYDTEAVAARALCLVMIETAAGLENAADICAVDGVDGIYVGPADLSIALGTSWLQEPKPAVTLRAIESLRDTCREAGVVASIFAGSGALGRSFGISGFQMVTLGIDSMLVARGAAEDLAAARARGDENANGEESR
jgi:4-hydroxy-2-oxoheptanedioate aldolase